MANDESDNSLRSTPQQGLELNPSDHDSSGNADVAQFDLNTARLFEQALEQTRMAITITDIAQEDQPMIYVNQAFLELTGYEREEVLGRNCRMLQGPETSAASVEAIRAALEAEEVRVIEILNYRRDGSTFWNALHVGPVYDEAGKLTHFYGSQWDITETVNKRERLALQVQVAEELQHRTGNLFNVIGSILRVSARGEDDVRALVSKVEGRLEALDKAHRISIAEGKEPGKASKLHDLIDTILAPYQNSQEDRVILSGPMLTIPPRAVTPMGLMLHELATNALKYGALSTEHGTIRVEWSRRDDRLELLWLEEGGPSAISPKRAGTGTRITEGVLRAVGARLHYDWPPTGLHARLDLPLNEG